MANLPETPDYPAGVYQIETSDPVLGGAGGIANRQAEQLGNRTAWLKAKIDAFLDGTVAVLKATKLATARTLSVSGAASGSASFDGSANANIALTLADSGAVAGTYPKVTVNAKGLVTGGAALLAADIPSLDWSKIGGGKPTTLGGYGITDAAPLASPTFTGNPAGPTPAQFDADGSFSTTEFVQRALGNRRNFQGITADLVLTIADAGMGYLYGSPGNINVTLPAKATSVSGATFVFQNTNSGTITVQAAAGDSIDIGPASVSSVVVDPYTSLEIVAVQGSTPWGVIGASVLTKYSGQIGLFPMTSAPQGWLKCNGAAISRTAYAALFAAIGTTFGAGDGSTTFNLPDLRGEFVRGWDDGRGVDTGRGFGTAQVGAIQSHGHDFTYKYSSGAASSSPATGDGALGAAASALGRNTVTPTDHATLTTAVALTGGTETRPRNIALLYCIKY